MTSQWSFLHTDPSEFLGVSKFRPTVQFQVLQMVSLHSSEDQSKTFENHIECVISRTPCLLHVLGI